MHLVDSVAIIPAKGNEQDQQQYRRVKVMKREAQKYCIGKE
jgi:hypothetical protein